MRTIITILFLAGALHGFSQDDAVDKAKQAEIQHIADSVAAIYKKMMSHQQAPQNQLNTYGRNYAAYFPKFNSGIALTALSGPLITMGVVYKNRKFPDPAKYTTKKGNSYTFDADAYTRAFKRYRAGYISFLIAGSISGGAGVVLMAIGIHDKKAYFRGKNVSLGLSSEGLGLAIGF